MQTGCAQPASSGGRRDLGYGQQGAFPPQIERRFEAREYTEQDLPKPSGASGLVLEQIPAVSDEHPHLGDGLVLEADLVQRTYNNVARIVQYLKKCERDGEPLPDSPPQLFATRAKGILSTRPE